MKQLNIQKYLKNNSIDKLKEDFAIIVKQHPEFPNLYLFKYNQIDSPFEEPIVQECRGIILDKDNNWKPVCMTYKKFFNYGETEAATIDWETAYCTEKIDGSLIQMFYYKNAWRIATSGMPNADGGLNNFNMTFKELFWKIWNKLKYKLPYTKCLCYAFELITPYNKVVVNYDKENIILHGVRNIETLDEIEAAPIAELNGWQCVKEYPFSGINEILHWCKEINPMKEEGYVIIDKHFNRIKIKSPQYVALSHTKNNMSIKKIIDIIKTNECSEFLTYFPEYTEIYNKIKNVYDRFILKLIQQYQEIKHIENQKDFALQAIKTQYSAPLFLMRSKQITNIRKYVNNLPSKKLVEILKIKENI